MTMVVAVGITLTGEKQVLGCVETGTENEKVLTPFLQALCDRGASIVLKQLIGGSLGLSYGVERMRVKIVLRA